MIRFGDEPARGGSARVGLAWASQTAVSRTGMKVVRGTVFLVSGGIVPRPSSCRG
ncbi:MAG: hypothetical protein HC897_19965 [Thermoanaerobaculia bacterium]|nr:hypothetical protein [Thermoanaerobaculia bacterium]